MNAAIVVEVLRRTLDVTHPLQYGGTAYGWDADELYNRCPNCEQWSPCDGRKAIQYAIEVLESSLNLKAESS